MSTDVLADQLRFMKLGPEAQANIQTAKTIIMRELPAALDIVYAQIRAFPETAKFFSSDGQIASAKSKQLAHWDAISSGRFNSDYVRGATAVGEVHAAIGLAPRWYIGGYALVVEALIGKIVEERLAKRGFNLKPPPVQQIAAELSALVKATLLDMDLAISAYLTAAEAARKRAEAAVLSQERNNVSGSVGKAMSSLADGDLTYRLADDIPAEYQQLRADFNGSMEKLQQTMLGISTTTQAIRAGTEMIAVAADDLSRRSERQAASLEETAAARDEITATVKRTADGASHARETVAAAKTEAEKAGAVVREAMGAMGGIEKSSRQIGQIISVIDEIAFQTNLLALNAGVEAARAGDAGRGFAVVAMEVRGLAQRSAEAAKEIKGLISASGARVDQGVHLVEATGTALQRIVEQVLEINQVVSNIATSAEEQATGLHQVNVAVSEMDKVTQQNAAMVEELTAAAHSLSEETERLAQMIGGFQIGRENMREATSSVAKASGPAVARPLFKAVGGGGTPTAARKSAAKPSAKWEEF
ncbi:MAG: methyl-accepting chemotaxis protein [Methylovirgula sp.]